MTTETPITFPKMHLLITVKCSADLATAAKLPGMIFRLLRKAGVSVEVTLEQANVRPVGFAPGGASTERPNRKRLAKCVA
jgi:hypothetical protein